MAKHRKTDIDSARDDLMSHIHRCGVLKAAPEHQTEWLNDTIDYLGECYPALSAAELTELKQIGTRFCQPVIPHGKGNTALTVQADAAGETATEEPVEEAGAEAEDSENGSESHELVGV